MPERTGTFALTGKRVLLSGALVPATIVISGSRITRVQEGIATNLDCPVEDAGESVVMAGLVDSHVHVNEPGRTEWEGFETATRAGAAGGVTTIADMPLNCRPVTTSLDALETKLSAAKGKLTVDCCFIGGVVPGNAGQLESMIERGVSGFKCFLIASGTDDFANVGEMDLRQVMPLLSRYNMPLLVHAELENGKSAGAWRGSCRSYDAFLQSRPAAWEINAVEFMVKLCRQYRAPVHIVHLSCADALPIIHQAKQQGLPVTAETCPHYLTFAAEEIPDGDTRFKCAPPVRAAANRERLWSAVKDGTIDFIVSDHSPCLPELKALEQGDLKTAWGGISSLQFRLPAIWSQAKRRGVPLTDLPRWLSERPAQFLGLTGIKGKLAAGCDADLVIWSPEKSVSIESSMIEHRHKITPYTGRQLYGLVEKTYVRGRKVFDGGRLCTDHHGQLILGRH